MVIYALRMVRTEEGKALRKDYEAHNVHHGYNEYRKLEPRPDGISNTISTVTKDYLVMDEQIRIRKLTPTECFRLMGFEDNDVEACRKAGISNSQLYKQAGNSIVVSVLEAIFGQMFEGKENFWKEHWG